MSTTRVSKGRDVLRDVPGQSGTSRDKITFPKETKKQEKGVAKQEKEVLKQQKEVLKQEK